MLELLPHPEAAERKRINRRHFVRLATAVAVSDLLQSKPETLPPTPQVTMREFLEEVNFSLPELYIRTEKAPPNLKGNGLGEWKIVETTWSIFNRIRMEEPSDVVEESTVWMADFQKKPPKKVPVYHPMQITADTVILSRDHFCSNYSREACDELNPKGYPMHVLNTLPADALKRGFKAWHQRALLKLDDRLFFIVDNNIGTIWHDTVGAYVISKNGGTMRRTPIASISRFRAAKWDIGPVRLAHMIKNSVHEDNMESLNIRRNSMPFGDLA